MNEPKSWREADVVNDTEHKLAKSASYLEPPTAIAMSANKKEVEKHAMRLSGKRHVLFAKCLNGWDEIAARLEK
jgi:hypothetical protein